MRVSRRMFLSVAAAAPALPHSRVLDPPRCSLPDLGSACTLKEPLAGFQMALRQLGSVQSDAPTHLILAGVGSFDETIVAVVHEQLGRGGTVLLECGFGFAEQADFAGRCLQLDRGLGIAASGLADRGSAYFPYIEYSWPVRVKIREFRPVSLKPARGDEVIGTFGGSPAALRRRVRGGTLVAIGSPIGPVFLTGDPDAWRWLEGFFAMGQPGARAAVL
jgi:hypothetical protein